MQVTADQYGHQSPLSGGRDCVADGSGAGRTIDPKVLLQLCTKPQADAPYQVHAQGSSAPVFRTYYPAPHTSSYEISPSTTPLATTICPSAYFALWCGSIAPVFRILAGLCYENQPRTCHVGKFQTWRHLVDCPWLPATNARGP